MDISAVNLCCLVIIDSTYLFGLLIIIMAVYFY